MSVCITIGFQDDHAFVPGFPLSIDPLHLHQHKPSPNDYRLNLGLLN